MLPKVFSEGFNCYFCALIKHKMVTLNDGMISLEPSCERSSLRVLSGTDLMGHSSIYMAKQWGPWMRSTWVDQLYTHISSILREEKLLDSVVTRRDLGALLVL